MPTLDANPYRSPLSVQQSGAQASARLALALLLAINLFNYIDRFVLAATLKRIEHDLLPGHDNPQFWLGLLSPAFLVTYMLAAPVFGWLADRMSRWVLICVGVLLWSLASAGSGLATTYAMLFATRIFVGIGEAVYGPAAPTLLADYFPSERRGQIMSIFYVAIPVGSALGFTLGGTASQYWGWRMAFFAVAPPGILLGLLCLLMRDPRGRTLPGAAARPIVAVTRHDYFSLLRNKSYVYNTLGMTAMTFALGGIAFWMPRYIEERSGRGEAEIGFAFGACTALAGLFAILTGGWVGDRLRHRFRGAYFLISAIGMIVAFPLFLLVLHVEFPLCYALIFITELCLFFNTGPTNTIIANVTRPAIRATAFAVNILIIHLFGDAISPPLIGAVNSAAGNMNAGFMVVSFAMLLSGVFWLLGRKHLDAETALVERETGEAPAESALASG